MIFFSLALFIFITFGGILFFFFFFYLTYFIFFFPYFGLWFFLKVKFATVKIEIILILAYIYKAYVILYNPNPMGIFKTIKVSVSLAQLVRTMHNICKVRDSNPGHHQKIQNNKK